MVPGIFIFFLFAVILYACTYEDSRFTATASAIRQIWSGSCRLNCRQSHYSGFSGLSGLVQNQAHEVITNRSSQPGPSRDCICESCPCALIENVLRTCNPARTLYNNLVEILSFYYYSILKMLTDTYNYVGRVAQCRVTCQRQAQITNKESMENFCFGDKAKREALSAKVRRSIGSLFGSKSETSTTRSKTSLFKTKSSTQMSDRVKPGDITFSEDKDKKADVKSIRSDTTLKPIDTSDDSVDKKSCSKCIEKGKTCIKSCPKADVSK